MAKVKHLNGQTVASMSTTVALLRGGAQGAVAGVKEAGEGREHEEMIVVDGQAMCELPAATAATTQGAQGLAAPGSEKV